MPRLIFDHTSLLLNGKCNMSDLKPFKFESMCLKYPRFANMSQGWWSTFHVMGILGQRVRLKLKLLRDLVKNWNNEVFGCVEEKKRFLEEIKHWDMIEESRYFTREVCCLGDMAKQDYSNVVVLEEIKWKQKAKVPHP